MTRETKLQVQARAEAWEARAKELEARRGTSAVWFVWGGVLFWAIGFVVGRVSA